MNVYQRGAHDGLLMGGYLTAMMLLMIAFPGWPLLSLVGLLMALAVPFVTYKLLRRGYVENVCESHFSTIWMHGITIFICGSLILGVAIYIYFRFVKPLEIASMVQAAADIYMAQDDVELQRYGRVFQSMINRHELPTPISIAFGVMWLGSFTGSMLSLVVAWIVKLTNKKR